MLILLIVFNIADFMIVGIDKFRSKRRRWRIPERIFFIVSALGGSVGVYAGLLFFRHKTRHRYFMLGIPMIIFIQIVILYFAYTYLR